MADSREATVPTVPLPYWLEEALRCPLCRRDRYPCLTCSLKVHNVAAVLEGVASHLDDFRLAHEKDVAQGGPTWAVREKICILELGAQAGWCRRWAAQLREGRHDRA